MGKLRVGFGGVIRIVAQVVFEFGIWGIRLTVDHEGGGRVSFQEVVYERNDCHDGGWGCEEAESREALDEACNRRGGQVVGGR